MRDRAFIIGMFSIVNSFATLLALIVLLISLGAGPAPPLAYLIIYMIANGVAILVLCNIALIGWLNR